MYSSTESKCFQSRVIHMRRPKQSQVSIAIPSVYGAAAVSSAPTHWRTQALSESTRGDASITPPSFQFDGPATGLVLQCCIHSASFHSL